MKKNKISRKEFISKTSKVVGGVVICPTILTILKSCDSSPVSSEVCADTGNSLLAKCSLTGSDHGGEFNTDGCPVAGKPTEPLKSYEWSFNDNTLLIEELLEIKLDQYPDLIVGSAISLDNNDIDIVGLLIYRKSESDFNVFSRICSHHGAPVNSFQ